LDLVISLLLRLRSRVPSNSLRGIDAIDDDLPSHHLKGAKQTQSQRALAVSSIIIEQKNVSREQEMLERSGLRSSNHSNALGREYLKTDIMQDIREIRVVAC
jgi:hypothetical protein